MPRKIVDRIAYMLEQWAQSNQFNENLRTLHTTQMGDDDDDAATAATADGIEFAWLMQLKWKLLFTIPSWNKHVIVSHCVPEYTHTRVTAPFAHSPPALSTAVVAVVVMVVMLSFVHTNYLTAKRCGKHYKLISPTHRRTDLIRIRSFSQFLRRALLSSFRPEKNPCWRIDVRHTRNENLLFVIVEMSCTAISAPPACGVRSALTTLNVDVWFSAV